MSVQMRSDGDVLDSDDESSDKEASVDGEVGTL